jgi:hypothetical protein
MKLLLTWRKVLLKINIMPTEMMTEARSLRRIMRTL